MSWLRKREVCNERNRREKVILTEGEFLRREEANKRYLMKLETPYLLRSYLHEAGRYSGRGPDAEAFGGWEDLSCQLRGHFLGHWLSAAALHYQETEDVELKAKTEVILKELELCQKITAENGYARFRKNICTG